MIKLDLSGKIAVITGATGQLGRVICKVLAECGADIAANYYKNSQLAEQIVDEITKEFGVRAISVYGDVTNLDSVFSMKDRIEKVLGSPDIVVDAAVIQYQWVSILEQPINDYESQFRSCVLHSVNMAKAFVPAMILKKWGRVIGINTECAMQCFENQSAYVSGKRGMDGIMRVLANEIGQYSITVNQVAPGWTISDNDRINNSEKQLSDEKIPLKRRGSDLEVANAVAFLASDLSSYITGAYIPVCGGNVKPCI